MGPSLASSLAWVQPAAQEEENGTIVAAGFGYQIGDVSMITVKVYDAVSGDVLSEDDYDLNVRDEQGAGQNSSLNRIFAGGIGLGASDLSNFVLRVYDAATGKFQWEGRLSLAPHEESGTGQIVSTVAPRRATITKIRVGKGTLCQPIFSLRAVDVSTGGIVWEDEFSADGSGKMEVQEATAHSIGLRESSAETFRTFDFRIRMFDLSGRGILWEDQVSHQASGEGITEFADDQARVLPAWPSLLVLEAASKRI